MKVVFVACNLKGLSPHEVKEIAENGAQIAANVLDEETQLLLPCLPYMIEEEYKRRDEVEAKRINALRKRVKEELKKREEAAKKGVENLTPDNDFDIHDAENQIELFENRNSRRNVDFACLGENIKLLSEADCVLFHEGYETATDEGKVLFLCATLAGKKVLTQTTKEVDLS